MQKSTILFLISLLFIVTSCATYTLEKDLKLVTLEKSIYNAPYFSNSVTDYVYKANITVYGNELSGIFIVKKINETTHRAVFTTEFGNKLLDFEISDTTFKINFIVDEFNKKILINTLKMDFKLLLRNKFEVQEQLENELFKVYLIKDGKNFNYLYLNKSNNKLSKILLASKRKEKISIEYTSENDIFANSIIINDNLRLQIKLNFISTKTE
jgi:hypothetical protein